MAADPIDEEAQESLTSFLEIAIEKDLVGEEEKKIKGDGLDGPSMDASGLSSVEISLKEARDEATLADEWRAHEADVLKSSEELRNELREKCDSLREKYEENKKARDKQIISIRSTIQSLESVPNVNELLKSISSSADPARFRAQQQDDGDSISIVPPSMRFRGADDEDESEDVNVEDETTSFGLRSKAMDHMQQLEEETARQAASSAQKFKQMEEERNEQIALAKRKEEDRAEAEVALKQSRAKAEEGVKIAQQNLNDAQDILLDLQKKCDIATSEADQADGEWNLASSAREASEKQLSNLHDDSADVSHSPVATAAGSVASAKELSDGEDEEAAQAELRARENLQAASAQSDAISNSFSTKIKALENQLSELRSKENIKRGKKSQADAKKSRACAASSAQKIKVKSLEQKLVQAEARHLQREEQYEAFSQGKALSNLPTPKPLVLHPCGLYTSCIECTENPSCGWEVDGKSGSCVIGTLCCSSIFLSFTYSLTQHLCH